MDVNTREKEEMKIEAFTGYTGVAWCRIAPDKILLCGGIKKNTRNVTNITTRITNKCIVYN